MAATLTVGFNVCLQLLVAAMLAGAVAAWGRGSRRTRVLDVWAWRVLRIAALPAAAGVVGLLVFGRTADIGWEPVPMFFPGLATLFGALGAGGVVLAGAAGRAERRGRLTASRRRVGYGGRIAFLGAAIQIVAWGATFFLQSGAWQRQLVAEDILAGQAVFGALLVGCGGFVALLAALTGKPRPAGAIGAVLYFAGYAALASAAVALAKLIN